MITHYWLDDPSVPFATLLLLVGTHCHPDAGPDAYTNLVTLARTRDDEEMRRFKTELRQALLGRTGGLHPDALFTQPRTATAPTTRSSRDSGGISNLTTPTHTTYSGSTPSTTSCHPRPVAPRRSSSTGGPTPTPTASGTTCSSLSDSSTPAASPLLRHGARHPRHPALDLPSWHDTPPPTCGPAEPGKRERVTRHDNSRAGYSDMPSAVPRETCEWKRFTSVVRRQVTWVLCDVCMESGSDSTALEFAVTIDGVSATVAFCPRHRATHLDRLLDLMKNPPRDDTTPQVTGGTDPGRPAIPPAVPRPGHELLECLDCTPPRTVQSSQRPQHATQHHGPDVRPWTLTWRPLLGATRFHICPRCGYHTPGQAAMKNHLRVAHPDLNDLPDQDSKDTTTESAATAPR